MLWLVYDTIENSFFFQGVLDVEQGEPLREVCTLIPNQVAYEHGRFFNSHLKNLGKHYSNYLTERGKIKSDSFDEIMYVIQPILTELDLKEFF